MKLLFLDGPMQGKVNEVPDDVCAPPAYRRDEDETLEHPAEKTSSLDKLFKRVDYHRHQLQNTLLQNEVVRIYTVANVAVAGELPRLPIDQATLMPAMEVQCDRLPRVNILDDFESWFNQTVYLLGIPCRQSKRIQSEIDETILELTHMRLTGGNSRCNFIESRASELVETADVVAQGV